jgi:hypothetical protein
MVSHWGFFSVATDGIALRVIGVLKLLYHDQVEVPTEEHFISLSIMVISKRGKLK